MAALQTSVLTSPPRVQPSLAHGVSHRRGIAAVAIHKAIQEIDDGANRAASPLENLRKPKAHESIARRQEELDLRRMCEGDAEALNALFDRHRARLYRAAFAVLHNKEEAEDAVQEGLLSAYLHLSSFQGRSMFSTWLTRIIINAALMKRRKQMAIPEISLDGDDNESPESTYAATLPASAPDPEQQCASAEITRLVRRKLNQLSPGHRSAIELRYIEELSTREAARSSEISVCKLKSRLFHARRQLALRCNTPSFYGLLTQLGGARRPKGLRRAGTMSGLRAVS